MSRISIDIPLDQPGRYLGRYHIPFSDNSQPYGHFGPIAVLANGSGPTLLLTGGTHGDEYPGPVAIMRLIQDLDLAAIQGRLILIPALNAPAVRAAMRCSPLDGGNMNRAFPGAVDGGPTAMIADWLMTKILPLADAAIDFHAGGRVTDYAPLAMVNGGPRSRYGDNLALARAFGTGLIWRLGALNDSRSVNGAAEQAGVPMMACELGGLGDANPAMIRIAHDGALNVMRHLGILQDGRPVPSIAQRMVESVDRANSHIAPHGGLFDPLVEIGTDVQAGDLAGWVRDPFELARAPTEIRFARSGHLAIRGTRGLVSAGDLLFGLVTDIA